MIHPLKPVTPENVAAFFAARLKNRPSLGEEPESIREAAMRVWVDAGFPTLSKPCGVRHE